MLLVLLFLYLFWSHISFGFLLFSILKEKKMLFDFDMTSFLPFIRMSTCVWHDFLFFSRFFRSIFLMWFCCCSCTQIHLSHSSFTLFHSLFCWIFFFLFFFHYVYEFTISKFDIVIFNVKRHREKIYKTI